MIGDVKLTYSAQDLIRLAKADILYKFGQRELAAYDLSTPGVFTTKANITQFPNPEVKITSVAQQIAQLNLVSKPNVPRADGSVSRDPMVGGDNILFDYDRIKGVTIIGGPVEWSEPVDPQENAAAHWVAIKVKFPLGIALQEGQTIPYVLNGAPHFIVVDEATLQEESFTFYFNAAMTTNSLTINWDSKYSPETIPVTITASLQDSAVQKIPALPTEPLIEFSYPEQASAPANISIDVDLSLGK